MREYKILEDISADVTLVQLMDSLGNVNHSISVVGNWIFDSNYEKELVLNMASLVESGKYGAINTTYISTNAFYVIMFTSGAYTLQ